VRHLPTCQGPREGKDGEVTITTVMLDRVQPGNEAEVKADGKSAHPDPEIPQRARWLALLVRSKARSKPDQLMCNDSKALLSSAKLARPVRQRMRADIRGVNRPDETPVEVASCRDPGLRYAGRHAVVVLGLALPGLADRVGILVVGLVGLVTVGILVLVIWPAVWSRKKFRRDAALAVLSRILGR
jgi:hypothetical protein